MSPEQRRLDHAIRDRALAFGMFATGYGLTAAVSFARLEHDSTAAYGFIPFAGPIVAAAVDDEDTFFTDGWDYLALAAAFWQVGSFSGIIVESANIKEARKALVVQPVATSSFSGVLLGGSF